jgi:hypothetical protein
MLLRRHDRGLRRQGAKAAGLVARAGRSVEAMISVA